MAGRKLSHKQARRVRSTNRERVALAGAPDGTQGEDLQGTVIARFGKQADVTSHDNPGEITRCFIRATIDSIVAGDHVVWLREATGGVIVARGNRHSELGRPDNYGKARILAANLDRIVIVVAAEPAPHPNLVDRYLVAAEDAGIGALILLNKSDLLAASAVQALLQPYTRIGYPVLQASAHTAGGLEPLRSALSGHTSALVGQSGVGKSSLIAALLPEEELRIGELSEAMTKGRHTTTTARLYRLPDGGALIDSPGIREFSLSHLDVARTASGFVEFRPFIGRCRFRDCKHQAEPGCAIREAVASGAVGAERYAGYLHIIGASA